MEEYRSRPSLIWPIMLIGAGVLFLLNNLGIVDWGIWSTLVRFWPLILVAVGLDIMLGRRGGIWPALLALVFVALIVSGTVAIDATQHVFMSELHTEEFSQQLGDVEKARVSIDFDIGELEITGMTSSSVLANGSIDLAEYEQLEQEYRELGGSAYLKIGSRGKQVIPAWWFGKKDGESRDWMITLNDEIPIELEVDLGVGKSEIDLRQCELNSLNVQTGVGKAEIYLPEEGDFNGYIQAGVGELIVYVPESLPIRITLETGLGNNSVVGDFEQSNNVYTSDEYAQSVARVNLNIDGGVGNINVIEISN